MRSLALALTSAALLLGCEGYQDQNTATSPDNTAVNERDRDGTTLTPADQSNSATDTSLTQSIRQAVMDVDDLSVNARNVKIIAIGGHVTLRGPVDNENEKQRIVAVARQLAGDNRVTDELEVVPPR